MEQSLTSDSKDYDYETTIARARRYVCLLVLLHIIVAAIAIAIIFVCAFSRLQYIILSIQATIDIVVVLLDIWELNSFYFFRASHFRCLIWITFVLNLLVTGGHAGLYFYLKLGDDKQMDLLNQILLLGAAGLALLAFLVTIIKNLFVNKKMIKGKDYFNKIKNSLISEEHFQYALKKSLSPQQYD